jgi:hypothetical protein
MTFDEIVTCWRRTRSRFGHRRLVAACAKEHRYQGQQVGHPSTFAFVRFECAPADGLTFELRAPWPEHLTPEDRSRLVDAMVAAVVDVLATGDTPHLGCALACVGVEWDDVASSEQSFYAATRAALTALRDEEAWARV